jgi:glyoxylase-like metal-dependent hydrolase (beta-lactamase superfamily II)
MNGAAADIELLPWQPPELGRAVDVRGGLRWLRLPVPGRLAHINVWLAPARAGGQVLIDTGMNDAGTQAAWRQLALSERLGEELRAILVTHHHPDHFGMAGQLAQRFAVPVRMSAPARAAAERAIAESGATAPRLADYRATWGVDFKQLLERAGAVGVFARLVSGVPAPSAPIEEGEQIGELREPWQASLHFGHAEGHVCLHWAQEGLMISGDQLLPSISSNISLYPGADSSDPLGDFLASLARLAQLPAATVVLPAHGQPFTGAAARAAQLRGGHEQRLARLLDFVAQPQDTPAVVLALFGSRNLEGWNALLAYGETLAHIRYLQLRGALTRLADAGAVHWVRA